MTEHTEQRRTTEPNYVLQVLEFFARMGSAEAIVHGERRYTYAETRAAVLAMATALTARGVRGDMTAVAVTRNHPESVILLLALHLLGCRAGFVAADAPREDQHDFIEQAGADVLIHDSGVADELISDAVAGAARPVLGLGPGEGRPDLLAEMVVAAAGSQANGAGGGGAGADHEPQSLFHTAGTTGPPKLVRHGQRFYQALYLRGQFNRASGQPGMRHLGIFPFATTSGQVPALLALFQGGTAVLMTQFRAAQWLAAIERERVTSTLLSPPRLREVLAEPALAQANCASLRRLNCGCGAAPITDLVQAIERFGPVVRVIYGMTEVPLIADYPGMDLDPAHPERLRSCGTAYASNKIEVRGGDGTVLPAGQTGTIWVTGPLLMDGYAGQPELTSRILAGGWLCTEDLGYTDPDGYLYLVDRAQDVITTGKPPVQVYSRVVEDVLTGHPGVRAAAVIGVPDTHLGEAVVAFVVRAPGTGVTAEELRDLVAGELTEAHAPREVQFVAELPTTPAGKVDKRALSVRYHHN
jgi:fatty-acyl-CoA synthase